MATWGTVGEFWRVFSEFNPEAIRHEAERPWRLAILGSRGSGKTALRRALTEGAGTRSQSGGAIAEAVGDDVAEADTADLCVYVVDATRGVTSADCTNLENLRRRGRRFVVMVHKCDTVENLQGFRDACDPALCDVPPDRIVFGGATQGLDDDLAKALLGAAPELRIALARRIERLRPMVGDELISEASRVNAEFALLSNLPANIPVIGGLLGGGADFLVLTKNQAMLVFKLAAIHGRDLSSKPTLIAELAPMVGIAFVWRTLAREAIGLLPTVIAAAPKMAIAYAGTFVIGKMAQYYYLYGRRPSKETIRQFAAEARRRALQVRGLIFKDLSGSRQG